MRCRITRMIPPILTAVSGIYIRGGSKLREGDGQLVRRTLAGDNSAFDELVERYRIVTFRAVSNKRTRSSAGPRSSR